MYETQNVELVQGVANGNRIQLNINGVETPLINVFDTQTNVSTI